ncbi:DUF1810 domain-containing protein [Mameliella alba]|nr:DUF1810 domain-containing protein [Antarctobacter heliothermus]MBY6142652.1 DUF1810 domain-containing protein [Mameliella alba]MCA0953623.1 DUF1810 domain-containing protein [Mameliella alba]
MPATHAEFLQAQDQSWSDVLRELQDGHKVTHWIWWVFPQLALLGRSSRARHFGLAGPEDAHAYLAHPVLGQRLVDVSQLLLTHVDKDPVEILGPIDAIKVRSSMTLFETVPGAHTVFSDVLERMYGGQRCPLTQDALTSKE